MKDVHRDRRLGDASDLLKEISSLGRVPADHRSGFIHDRLMSAIDDICDKNRREEGVAVFNQRQVLAIKDVAFHIVYLLDPKNQPPNGIIKNAWQQWRATSLTEKVAIIGGVCAIVSAVSAGSIFLWSRLSGPQAALVSPTVPPEFVAPSPTLPPAANTLPTDVTPAK